MCNFPRRNIHAFQNIFELNRSKYVLIISNIKSDFSYLHYNWSQVPIWMKSDRNQSFPILADGDSGVSTRVTFLNSLMGLELLREYSESLEQVLQRLDNQMTVFTK